MATDYLQTDEEGHVTWIGSDSESRVVDFTKLAQAYATDASTKIDPVAKATASNPAGDTTEYDGYTILFNNLKLGYYLVDSSTGALCSLDTLASNIEVQEKNLVPTVEKKVQENSNIGTNKEWDDANDANIGDIVKYQSKINLKYNSINVVFHDIMTEGLTFNYDENTEWSNEGVSLPGGKVDNLILKLSQDGSSSTITLVEGENKDYVVNTDSSDNSFTITFKDYFYQRMSQTGENGQYVATRWNVLIEYSAVLNEKAFIGNSTSDNKANINKCYVSYGDKNSHSLEDETVTNTWQFSAMKYAEQGTEKLALSGAKFKLYRNEIQDTEGGKVEKDTTIVYIKFVPVSNCEENSTSEAVYRVAEPDETNNVTDTIVTNKSGKFTIIGLDSATYNLLETEPPFGYNKLSSPIRVTIDKDGIVTGPKGTIAVGDYLYVLNNSGAVLPSTGGIGTTIFYVAGSILLIGAAVLLIVKKRMSDEK